MQGSARYKLFTPATISAKACATIEGNREENGLGLTQKGDTGPMLNNETTTPPPHLPRRYDICPRCGRSTLRIDKPHLNALSRTDDSTYVCSDCGLDEALQAWKNGGTTHSKDRWKAPQLAHLKHTP